MRRLDAQLRDTRKKLAAAVKVSGTTLTEVFGVGPVIAGTIIGDIADIYRFPGRDHFASCNGTAPVEVSSGNRKIHRLSLRGNRRINHAIHMAAITQLRHKHSEGRAYYEKKLAEGKTHKEALRSLKRKISDAIFAASRPTPARLQRPGPGPGRAPGERLCIQHGRLTPQTPLSDKPLPDLAPAYDPAPLQAHRRSRSRRKLGQPLDTNSKEDSICATGTARRADQAWPARRTGGPATERSATACGLLPSHPARDYPGGGQLPSRALPPVASPTAMAQAPPLSSNRPRGPRTPWRLSG